ncbi:uncharacterized protein LOC135470777 [Liolophura sinensis]|uniref:uncharacterized protein LOC135470777 n=1 Tax=Liolophura sinensis TaxID=3198878 RepID=UPI003157FD2D
MYFKVSSNMIVYYLFGLALLLATFSVDVSFSQTESDDESYHLISVDYTKFSEQVLHSNDSWILIFYRGQVDQKWKELAKSARGLTWLGTVDVKSQSKLLQELGLDAANVPKARVYPFGGYSQKLSEWQDVHDWKEAERFALKSIPADIPVLSSSTIDRFIKDSHYSSSTPRFPAVYLTDSTEVSPVLRAIKERFRRYFSLSRLLSPTTNELRKLGLEEKKPVTLPSLIVVIKQREKNAPAPSKTKPQRPTSKPSKAEKSTEDHQPRLVTQAVQYDANNFGELSYSGVMRFFFSVNHQFRYTLPEGSDKDTKTQAMMADVMDIEQERFDEFFNRKHISKSQKAERNSGTDKPKAGKSKPENPDKKDPGGKCPFGFDKLSGDFAKPNRHQMKKEEL